MLNLMPVDLPRGRGLTRRDVMRLGTASAVGAGWAQPLLARDDDKSQPATHPATAKNCIFVFLCGGPSQLDMWDPKPTAPEEIRGPFAAIDTNVPGIRLGELLPRVARHADKFAIVRSMNVDTTSHDVGILRTLLASKVASAKNKPYPPEASDHPAIGAILHKLLGRHGYMPPWAVVPRYFTTGDRFYKGQTAGFLGQGFAPFSLEAEKKDSLGRSEFEVKNAELYGGTSRDRFDARRLLLDQLQTLGAGPDSTAAAVRGMQQHYENAFEMLSSTRFRDACDVTREKPSLRERYGMNEYGQSFLLARRLVERDVRFVNVFWTFYGKDGCQFNLWDNHGSDKDEVCGGPTKGVEMIQHEYCCPSFDKAFSTLLADLDERGLLESTLVVVVGEFGRTPLVNANQGRDHWGACYSAVLAGGGVQGGRTYGASDGIAAYVKDSPVSPYDLHATILHAFGLSPETTISDVTGRPIPVSDGHPVTELF